MLKAAAVDIGTNSCRLLIAEANSNNSLKILNRAIKITRLGEGVEQTKLLKKEAVKRVIDVLKQYKNIIKKHEVEKIKIVGTSVLRDVKNPELLIDKINDLGLKIEIISGNKEAELNYLGAVSDLSSDFLLIDIGGGSTEFIWTANSKINFKSLDIGCVRMTENFISAPDKKIKNQEINDIANYVKDFLKKELALKKKFTIKGVGGTITTLAAVKLALTTYDNKKIENLKVDVNELEKILNNLSQLDLENRKKVKGLQPERADIITAGLVILKTILNHFGSDEIYVSDHDLLYGILKKELLNNVI